jgi:hypothetical protein
MRQKGGRAVPLAAIAVLQLLLGRAVATERGTSDSGTTDVLEALIRHMAIMHCEPDGCELRVDGTAPSRALTQRLRDLRNLHTPSEEMDRKAKREESRLIIDVGPVTLLRDKRASVGGSLMIGTAVLLSCDYPLRRTQKGWQVLHQEAKCAIT